MKRGKYSSMLLHHSPAFFGAGRTLLCTFLAMLHVMHLTLTSTCFTYVCAGCAKQGSMSSADRHEFGRRPTNGGTLAIKFNALKHHFNIIFP